MALIGAGRPLASGFTIAPNRAVCELLRGSLLAVLIDAANVAQRLCIRRKALVLRHRARPRVVRRQRVPQCAVVKLEQIARYLRDLLKMYDGALWHALAAYNAGPGAVAKYKGLPPYAETLRYIIRIDQDRKKAGQ